MFVILIVSAPFIPKHWVWPILNYTTFVLLIKKALHFFNVSNGTKSSKSYDKVVIPFSSDGDKKFLGRSWN